jgi:hypothetical protein
MGIEKQVEPDSAWADFSHAWYDVRLRASAPFSSDVL